MKITKYPDGTSYVEVVGDISHKPIVFRLNTYEDLWHLNQFVDAYNSKYKAPPTITIPWLIDGQADRRFADNQSSGLRLVLQFLNTISANFKVFHPHNGEIVEAIMNNVEIISNVDFINDVLLTIQTEYDYHTFGEFSSLVLASSDAGGFKSLMKLCDKIGWKGETFSASKSRTWDATQGSKLVQQVDKEDFGGKDILLIDDCCIFGGTFKGLSKLLRGRNCGKLYLAVSHMTVDNLGEDHIGLYFDRIFTTNSKYDFYGCPNRDRTALNQIENLQIIKIFS